MLSSDISTTCGTNHPSKKESSEIVSYISEAEASKILAIIEEFAIEGQVTEIIPWGNGLINDTYRINTDGQEDYLLQRVNGKVYDNVDGIIRNIYLVTETIRKQKFYLRNGRQKQDLHLILRKNGELYLKDPDGSGSGWRVYNFIKDAYSIEVATEPFEMYKSGILLGQFHYLMRDFPIEDIIATYPHFHDPVYHYHRLLQAAETDLTGRAAQVQEELDFFRKHEGQYSYFNDRILQNQIPIRLTHNDAKINNVMFDRENKEPICMVDLDTIMPGIIPFDFGDAIRSAMCTGKDTGPDMDISRIHCDMDIYTHFYRGFLEGCQGILTQEEIDDLPHGAIMIAMENAMRYLEDYLNGNVYFKVKYEEQNLIKTRMHIRLAEDMMLRL